MAEHLIQRNANRTTLWCRKGLHERTRAGSRPFASS
jgi:hypothetical protein